MTDERIKEELKPCPFCGSVEHLEIVHADELRDDECASYNGDSYTVVCNYLTGGCGANCGFVTDKNETAKKWNTRAAERLAKIEELEYLRDKSEYKMNPEMYRFFSKRIAELKEEGE